MRKFEGEMAAAKAASAWRYKNNNNKKEGAESTLFF